MEDDHQELYLQKLQEFIYDEDKIVTYTWLSKKLQLSVKECKELLEQFVKDHRSSKAGDLGVTYVILGKLKDGGTNTVAIVKESELGEKKKLFDDVRSECVYSVQKAKDVNLNVVCMIDMFDTASPQTSPLLGSVISRNSVKRNIKEKKPLPVLNRAAPTDKSKASHLFGKASDVKKEVKEPAQAIVKKEQKEGKPENKSTTPSKASGSNKTKSNQKNALAGMFAKMPPKSETKPSVEVKKESDSDEKMDTSNGDPKKAQNGSKSTHKKSAIYDSGSDEEARKIEERNKSKTPASQKKQTKKGVSKKRQKGSDDERPQKRRKRIVERNDSDSDDIFGDENDENEENVVKISYDDEPILKRATPFQDDGPKNKQRKLVDKTYEDEEGYVVTVQEWVTVSGSEEETEPEKPKPEQKKESPPATVKKPVPAVKEAPAAKPGKGKKAAKPATNQPTLMSFFSKK